jgi:hypothetical protein
MNFLNSPIDSFVFSYYIYCFNQNPPLLWNESSCISEPSSLFSPVNWLLKWPIFWSYKYESLKEPNQPARNRAILKVKSPVNGSEDHLTTMFYLIKNYVRKQAAHHTSVMALWETKWKKRVVGLRPKLEILCIWNFQVLPCIIPFGKANWRILRTFLWNS